MHEAYNWQELLPELLSEISKRLTLFSDYVSFRGVCISWRLVATFDNAIPQVPFLLLAMSESMSLPHEHKFFDLSKKRLFRAADIILQSEANSTYYYLSCSGWLLGIAKNSVRVYLTHPITRIRIHLPDLDTFPEFTYNLSRFKGFRPFISKMVFSSTRPSPTHHFAIMVIWGARKQLGFSSPGDSSWTVMESWDCSFADILYHKGKLYAIDSSHRVVVCNVFHRRYPTRILQISGGVDGRVGAHYECSMVESSGKLLIVSPFFVKQIRLFEFDLEDGSQKEIYDLGNKTLFLSSHSPSLCLEDLAWNGEVKPNSIYFGDLGFCLHFGGNERYTTSILGTISECVVGAPTWVVPGF